MRARALAMVLSLSGCLAPGEGQFACPAPERACPGGWYCHADGLCHSTPEMDAGDDASLRRDSGAVDAATVDAGPPPCDPGEAPDVSGGVFVREGATGDGTGPTSPLGSLAAAIPLARTGRPHVYVAEGTYPEELSLDAPPAGLVIDGGWIVTGGVWRRDCEAGRAATLIASPGSRGARIADATLGVELRHLTIQTAAPGASAVDTAGASPVALLVSGDGGSVTLSDVHLRARDGGDGGAAADPAAASAPSCDGTTCGDGLPGAPGADGLDGIAATAFDAAGYTPVDGSEGSAGGAGHDGSAGGGGYTAATNCCGGCNGGGGCSTTCNAGAYVPQGRCGCGGRPGGAGRPGRGGGASVGLLVAGADTTVVARWSVIESGAGGAGSPGGAAASGSVPGAGLPGMAECCTTCRVASPCPACSCFREACTSYSSTAGGAGGAAGASGRGGGGAGGPSYAVVVTSGGRFAGSADPTNALRHGPGGAGGGLANGGASGLVLMD